MAEHKKQSDPKDGVLLRVEGRRPSASSGILFGALSGGLGAEVVNALLTDDLGWALVLFVALIFSVIATMLSRVQVREALDELELLDSLIKPIVEGEERAPDGCQGQV